MSGFLSKPCALDGAVFSVTTDIVSDSNNEGLAGIQLYQSDITYEIA